MKDESTYAEPHRYPTGIPYVRRQRRGRGRRRPHERRADWPRPDAEVAPSTILLGAFDLRHLALAAGIWIVLTAGSLAVVLRVVLALPADYFERNQPARVSWTLRRILRNIAGVLLVVAGAVLSIPGVPGQGLLTMLVGVLLVDFPQRQRMERALARRAAVLTALNRLRTRFGRAPLRPPPP